MSTYQTQGLVLSSQDFREADKFFSIYTDTRGKIECLATGVRKIKSKLRAHLEPFSVVDLMIANGRRHNRLTSAIVQKSYKKIRSDYNLITFSFSLLEIIDQLTKLHHPDPRIFNLLKESFDFVENREVEEAELKSIRAHFILNFLSLLGYTPELKICVRCKGLISNPAYFSFADGSVICEKCVNNDQQISPESVKVLNIYLNTYLDECFFSCPENIASDECCKLVDDFLVYQLDRPLKSDIFVKK